LPFGLLAREITGETPQESRGSGLDVPARAPGSSPRLIDRPSPSRPRFLIEDKPVALLTSLQLWDQIARKPRHAVHRVVEQGRLSVFGDPDGTLPLAREEARRVGVLFRRSVVYLGPKATRERAQNLPADARIAHFATHAALDRRDINDCFLLLANGERLTLGA